MPDRIYSVSYQAASVTATTLGVGAANASTLFTLARDATELSLFWNFTGGGPAQVTLNGAVCCILPFGAENIRLAPPGQKFAAGTVVGVFAVASLTGASTLITASAS
jgi:hypothetical protein